MFFISNLIENEHMTQTKLSAEKWKNTFLKSKGQKKGPVFFAMTH